MDDGTQFTTAPVSPSRLSREYKLADNLQAFHSYFSFFVPSLAAPSTSERLGDSFNPNLAFFLLFLISLFPSVGTTRRKWRKKWQLQEEEKIKTPIIGRLTQQQQQRQQLTMAIYPSGRMINCACCSPSRDRFILASVSPWSLSSFLVSPPMELSSTSSQGEKFYWFFSLPFQYKW